jgi:hypothetical protein
MQPQHATSAIAVKLPLQQRFRKWSKLLVTTLVEQFGKTDPFALCLLRVSLNASGAPLTRNVFRHVGSWRLDCCNTAGILRARPGHVLLHVAEVRLCEVREHLAWPFSS